MKFPFFKTPSSKVFDEGREAEFKSTYEYTEVEFAGKTYHVRELSLSERTYLVSANTHADGADQDKLLMITAWIMQVACREFKNDELEHISASVSPSFQNFITEKILHISGMYPDAVEDEEKKS